MTLCLMNTLPARRADQSEIMECGDRCNALVSRQRRQIEREIEQTMQMENVGANGFQDMGEAATEVRWSIAIFETVKDPVVDHLSDGDFLMESPCDGAMISVGIVFGAEDRYSMSSSLELLGQMESIDLRTRAMAGQEVMDRVQNSQAA